MPDQGMHMALLAAAAVTWVTAHNVFCKELSASPEQLWWQAAHILCEAESAAVHCMWESLVWKGW